MASNDREIERKYLLKALPGETGTAPSVEIDQGYLPGERILERIRRIRVAGNPGDRRYFRTIKMGSGIDRFELEEETTELFFTTVWPLTRGRRIQKRRYTIMAGPDEWVIDDFADRVLVLAEIELERVGQPVQPPLWLESLIDREVTYDDSYSNYRLAR